MVINKKRMLEEFFELVKITSNTRNEREVADVVKAKLEALGGKVVEDNAGAKFGGNAGNVIATFEATEANLEKAPVIAIAGHLDNVEPCIGIEPVLENGLIYAKSNTILGGDDKSGVVPILESVRVLKESKLPHGKIYVIFSVAEEGGLFGSKNIDQDLLKGIDYIYEFDSDGAPGTIINDAPGQNHLKFVVKGKKAHAGVEPEKGINAIVLAAKALAQLKVGRIDEETTSNIGKIEGGIATNIVPDRVEIYAEVRSRDMDKLQKETYNMVKTFQTIVEEHQGEIEAEVEEAYKSYKISETEPFFLVAIRAAEAIGLKVNIMPTGGGTDANNYNGYGIPSLAMGTGMNNIHTPEENLREIDLYDTARWILQIIAENNKVVK